MTTFEEGIELLDVEELITDAAVEAFDHAFCHGNPGSVKASATRPLRDEAVNDGIGVEAATDIHRQGLSVNSSTTLNRRKGRPSAI